MPNLTPVQRASLIKKQNALKRKNKVKESLPNISKESDKNTPAPEYTDGYIYDKEKITEIIKLLQDQHKKNVEVIKEDKSPEASFVQSAMIKAEEIWFNVQVLAMSKKYNDMSDDERIKLIQKDFSDFYKSFPIVSRYMICSIQYSSAAFRKMLVRCKTIKIPKCYENDSLPKESKDPKDPKGKGKQKMEDSQDAQEPKVDMTNPEIRKDVNEKLWIERQADYVQFLWEEYHGPHFNQDDSNKIWDDTYNALQKEFDDFRQMYEDAEQKIKDDEVKHKKELLYEMSERLISGKQAMNEQDTRELINKLKMKLFKQRYDNTMKELRTIRQEIPPATSGVGTNAEAQAEYEAELAMSYKKKHGKKMDISKFMA
jgi:hypothetical protein